LISLFIGVNVLDKHHEETKTGLEAQELGRAEREAERDARRAKRASKGLIKTSLPLDTEKGTASPTTEGENEVKV